MTNTMSNVMELLVEVPDVYDDFVISMKTDLKRRPDLIPFVIDYMKEDRSRTTSDILGYFWSIDGSSDEEIEIVDDDVIYDSVQIAG